MDPILIIFIVVVFGGSYGYMFYIRNKQKKTTKNYETPEMVAKSEEFKAELLQRIFSPLNNKFPNQTIDAFTECAYLTNLAAKTKSTLITGLKVIGYSLIGVRATYTQADNAAYLVLTGEDLHYVFFQEGELSSLFTLTRGQLQRAKITDLSAVDKTSRIQSTVGDKVSKKLIYESDGKNVEIILFDRITKGTQGIPLSDASSSIVDILGKCRVMGISFKEKLIEQYPNLKY
ncbi:hypothetical protein HX052_01960 [Myroides marinus]|uniref:hypothetical protein n=1 Tax=Myroides marinus TaxID=703342 RepID=UPI0025790254|nr:hypothetical protein [Myroides marinus]MDM1388742.1 hypothetical protein [Myroides marinus]